MRTVYGAVFVGFAIVGFVSVFNTHSPALARNTNSLPAQPLSAALVSLDATRAPAAITVETDLVQPDIVGDGGTGTPSRGMLRSPASRARSRTSRSMLARFVFGDGQFRPQPFPTPASGQK
jgi:hypothetical protein